jgi:aspartate/methionine/tyrosine aminotransferase
MKISEFKLERYLARYEFKAPYLLCCSDCEPLSLSELVSIADSHSLKMWKDLKLGYTESQGHPVLREEVSVLYETITPGDVLILTPEEGIFIVMNNVLNKGDHVITTFPGYQSLYEIANSLGCEVSKWTPENRNGWVFDTDKLKTLIKNNTKLIVINFPHNPTGAILQQKGLEEIVAIAGQKNIILFSDEMYRFLEHDSINRTSSACDIYSNAVSLSGMSKSFALAGLRIGWLATKNKKLFRQFALYKDYTTICSSAPAEVLSIMALRAKDQILNRNLEIIKTNLELLDPFFASHKHLFEWYRPKAGPVAFPELKAGKNTAEFCRDLVEKKGVLLLPANQFDVDSNHFRIGFARKSMPEALSKLKEYFNENYR